MAKRLLSSLLAIVLVFGIAPFLDVKSSAAIVYDREKALQYAENHWNDGKGFCAEFVSDCLYAGGLKDSYQRRVVNLYNALLNEGYGEAHKLTLTGDSIKIADNKGKLKAGDPIFFYCNVCGDFTHVSLCNGANAEGYVVEYAHNNPKDGKTRLYGGYHCGTSSWTMYSISLFNHIETSEEKEEKTLYGQITEIDAPEITGTINLTNGIYIRWNEIENADYYKVYRKSENSGWQFLKNTTDVVFTDETAQNGVTYTYTVRGASGKTYSAYYEGVEATFLSTVSFTKANKAASGISLSWNENKEADGYIILKQTNNGTWQELTIIESGSTTSFTDAAIEDGNSYCYRIRACKNDITSSYNANGIQA